MATWITSGYKGNRGGLIQFTYTATYEQAANRTKIVASSYYVEWKTDGTSTNLACGITGSFTVSAADNASSYKTLSVSLSDNGHQNPKKSKEWNETFYVQHGISTNKQIKLAFSGEVHSHYYYSDINDSTTVSVATAIKRSLTISKTGATATVRRTASPWAATGEISSGGTVYDGDTLRVTFSAATGFKDATCNVSNIGTVSSGGTFVVKSNHTVTVVAVPVEFLLSISKDANSALSVTRGGSELADGTTLYYGDALTVVYGAPAGYKIETATLNGAAIASGANHTVTSNVAIIIVSKAQGQAEIGGGENFAQFAACIGNGTLFELYIPYIGNGESWDLY